MVISKPFMALRLYPAGPGALLLTPFTVPGFNNVVDGAADTLGGDAGILPTPWVSLSMRLNGPQVYSPATARVGSWYAGGTGVSQSTRRSAATALTRRVGADHYPSGEQPRPQENKVTTGWMIINIALEVLVTALVAGVSVLVPLRLDRDATAGTVRQVAFAADVTGHRQPSYDSAEVAVY